MEDSSPAFSSRPENRRDLFLIATAMLLVSGFPVVAPAQPAAAAAAELKGHHISESSTPADVFARMSGTFLAEKARGIFARYSFDLSGPTGGKWWITVADGAFKMGTGAIEKPDVIIATSDKDWVRLSTGSLGGTRAFLTGRLKFNGDRGLAQKLDDFFP